MNILYQLVPNLKRSKKKFVKNYYSPTYRRNRMWRLFWYLISIIILHTIGMVLFEGMNWWDGAWLSMTSATTVGYGDVSASTPWGRITTIFLMYVIGISLLAQLASEYIEYRISIQEKKLKGLWVWKNMHNHLVIINTPKYAAERYLTRLVTQLQATPGFEETPVQLLTMSYEEGLPKALQELGVVHYRGRGQSKPDLESVNILTARCVLLLARDENDAESDSFTFDTLEAIYSFHPNAFVISEAVEDVNRERFKKYGSNSVIRPIRAYPELAVRALAAHGTEQVLENLFTHEGDYPWRVDLSLCQVEWKRIILAVLELEVGLPIGFIDESGTVHTNPKQKEVVTVTAILILARSMSVNEEKRVIEHLIKL